MQWNGGNSSWGDVMYTECNGSFTIEAEVHTDKIEKFLKRRNNVHVIC